MELLSVFTFLLASLRIPLEKPGFNFSLFSYSLYKLPRGAALVKHYFGLKKDRDKKRNEEKGTKINK